jgi:hypothetical protein
VTDEHQILGPVESFAETAKENQGYSEYPEGKEKQGGETADCHGRGAGSAKKRLDHKIHWTVRILLRCLVQGFDA